MLKYSNRPIINNVCECGMRDHSRVRLEAFIMKGFESQTKEQRMPCECPGDPSTITGLQ